MIDKIEVMLKQAVTDVFGTLLSMEARGVPMTSESMGDEPHVAGSVGFIGDLTGVVYIYCSAAFARHVTATALQMAVDEIDGEEMINDSMGELANMVVGSLKSKLVEKGRSCILTIPSIVRGSHFSIEATSTTTRRVACFRCQDKANVVVEILIKPQEESD